MSLVRVSVSIVLVLLVGGCATSDRVAGHDAVNAGCSRALREANGIRVPLNPSRLPAPVPRSGRSGA